MIMLEKEPCSFSKGNQCAKVQEYKSNVITLCLLSVALMVVTGFVILTLTHKLCNKAIRTHVAIIEKHNFSL